MRAIQANHVTLLRRAANEGLITTSDCAHSWLYLTHAARAATEQPPFQPPLVAARELPCAHGPSRAASSMHCSLRREANERTTGWITREGLWLEQGSKVIPRYNLTSCGSRCARALATRYSEFHPRAHMETKRERERERERADHHSPCWKLPDFVWPHAAREARGAAAKLPPHRGQPNQVLTHAARAAAEQLNKPFQPPLVAAREGLWLEQPQGRQLH